jgi:putative membrane protein
VTARPRRLAALLLLVPAVAGAHAGDAPFLADFGTRLLLIVLLLAAWLYARGHLRMVGTRPTSPAQWRRLATYYAGLLVLAAALLPPLDTWSATRFAAHMIQHEVLMLMAAPLLVLGRPLPMYLWAFNAGSREALGQWVRRPGMQRAWRCLMHPAAGWTAHSLALWAWHVPTLFHAAVAHRGVHDLQHVTFVVTALWFWSGLFMARGAHRRAGAVLYLFTTTVHTSVLGALITFANRAWYVPVFSGSPAEALQDQQLGGLIMWVPGSMVYVVAGLVLFLQWVRQVEAY